MRPKTKRKTSKQPKGRLFSASCVDGDGIGKRLAGLQAGAVEVSVFSVDALRAALGQGADPVIVFAEPVRAIARAISAGTPPTAALAGWQTTMSEIMAEQRRARRRILLVGETRFLQSPEDEDSALVRRIPLGYAPAVTPGPVDALFLCLAEIAFRSDPGALALAAELEAASLFLEDARPGSTEIDGVFAATRDTTARLVDLGARLKAAEENAAAVGQERKLHREQITHLQSETTALVGRAEAGSKALAAAKAEIATLSGTLEQQEGALAQKMREAEEGAKRAAAFGQERKLYCTQIAQLQSEIATQAGKLAETCAQAEKERAAAQKVRAEIAALSGTLEQQKGALAQKARETEEGAKRAAALDRERRLYREQIAHLQSEIAGLCDRETALQARFSDAEGQIGSLGDIRARLAGADKALARSENRRAQVQADLSAAEDRLASQFRKVKRLGQELSRSQARLAETQARLDRSAQSEQALTARVTQLETEYSRVLMSHSWNVTKPLRMANKVLGGSSGRKK